ncbi:MAG: response regulator [Terriglobia bacterium]
MVGQLSGRVLLVDDEPLVRRSIAGYLVEAGYVVRVAVDGLDAIGKLREGSPALIISDLNMPRMSGFELLDVVRKRFPQIPVIVISGAAADEMPEGVAADAYCRKDKFLSEQLLQTMSDLTRKPPLRTAPPHVDNTPVQAICDRDGDYIIGCEDCLRVFSVPRAPSMRRDEKWTLCVHCGKVFQFLVAHGDPDGPAQP